MKKNWRRYCTAFIGLVAAIIIVVILVILMRGKTTTVTENIPSTKYDSLRCVSNDIGYPFFIYDRSNSKNLNVDLIFAGDVLRTIALEYTLYYDDESFIKGSEAHNHAAMNISFGANGLDPDEFNAKYTRLKDNMRMNLYAKGTDVNETTAKYFLINTDDDGEMPTGLAKYEANYTGQGFVCETN